VLGYRPALDGLRGLAFVAVLTTHCAPALVTGGIVGLEVFFVLCGFLITALLLQEYRAAGSINLKAFYLRRAFRILPALFPLLLGCFLYDWLCSSPEQFAATRKDICLVLCHCFNWHLASDPWHCSPMLVHCWSLSLEGQFYLVWPLVLTSLLVLRVRRRRILVLLGLGIVIPSLLRCAVWSTPFCIPCILVVTEMQVDTLCAGVLVGVLAAWGLLPRSWGPCILLQLAVAPAVLTLVWHYLVCEHIHSNYMHRAGFTLVALAASVLLAALVSTRPWLVAWVLERPLVGWLGRISYGGYLWNWPISYRLFLLTSPRFLADHPWVKIPLGLILTVVAGALSHYCVEQPCLRWYQRRSKAIQPVGASRTGLPARRTLAA
jgi:peptidoglycan/LPS O-acetylase OafA/YrhL